MSDGRAAAALQGKVRLGDSGAAFAWIFVAILAFVCFSLSIFLRDARVVGLFLFSSVFLLHSKHSIKVFFRTEILWLVVLAILLSFILLLQMLFPDPQRQDMLALRQISYFFLLPMIATSACVIFELYGQKLLSMQCVILVCASIAYISTELPPLTPEDWIWRANIENTTAFFLLFLFFRYSNRSISTIIICLAYGLYALLTSSGQGVIVTVLILGALVPSRLARRSVIFMAGTMPIWFPVVMIGTQSLFENLDSNVNFRYRIWSTILENFITGHLQLGKFGLVVNADFATFLDQIGVVGWQGTENIGAHNFTLQSVQLGGILAYAYVIVFLVFLSTRMMSSKHTPSTAAYIALSVSLALNQAESHLLNLFGTTLLFAASLTGRYVVQSLAASGASFDGDR